MKLSLEADTNPSLMACHPVQSLNWQRFYKTDFAVAFDPSEKSLRKEYDKIPRSHNNSARKPPSSI